MAAEIELKFTVPTESARTLGRLPPVRASAHGRPVSRTVRSVYYDTPEFDLSREQVSLRLRRDRGAWSQTIKGAPHVAGGLHNREERDTPLAAPRLDHAALVESGLSNVFSDARRLASLRPVFETDFRRTTRELDLGDGRRAELAIDVGAIRAGEVTAPINEVEIELQQGQPTDLVDFALSLLEHTELHIEPRTKAARGYALATGTPAPPRGATVPVLDPNRPVADAFERLVAACVHDLVENGRGMLDDGHPEFLHQARIAIRRLRLVFRTFADTVPAHAFDGALATVDWLAEDLGRARDWDVFVIETLPVVTADLGTHADLRALSTWASRERDLADCQARAAVASKRHTRMVLELTRAMLRSVSSDALMTNATLTDFAADQLSVRHKAVVRQVKRIAELDEEGLHALRKDIKKLRYLAGMFGPLWPKKRVRPYVQELARLQDLLGAVNDAVVVGRLLAQWRNHELTNADYETIGLIRGWLLARMREHIAQFPEAWTRFDGAGKFWRRKAKQ